MLAETSTRLTAILETAIDFAIITMDEKGNITDWNSGAETMFSYTRAEVIGKFADFIFTPEDIYGHIPQLEFKRALEVGEALDERWHIRKDGSRFFMSGVMKPLRHQSLNGFVKITRDITDRKLAEEALFLSEQHKSLAVQSAQMGEWNYDLNQDLISGDEQCRKLMAIKDSEKTWEFGSLLQLIHEDDRPSVKQALDTALDGLNIFHSEFRVRHADATTTKWISVYGRVVAHVNDKPSRLIGVIYDITNRKMLEAQKDDFINIASHELRSPVTSIKAYTELLGDMFDQEGDSENGKLIKKLNAQVDRLVRLIYNLLDASTLSQLTMKLKPQPLDINQLIDNQILALPSISRTDRIVFNRQALPLIHADPERIGQVIENLLSNALKYSGDKPVIVTTEDALEGIKVSVRDYGPGIPETSRTSIFERYYRVASDGKTASPGLGLGLYIASEIIRQHFGTIGVEGNVGEGAVFYFTLPAT